MTTSPMPLPCSAPWVSSSSGAAIAAAKLIPSRSLGTEAFGTASSASVGQTSTKPAMASLCAPLMPVLLPVLGAVARAGFHPEPFLIIITVRRAESKTTSPPQAPLSPRDAPRSPTTTTTVSSTAPLPLAARVSSSVPILASTK